MCAVCKYVCMCIESAANVYVSHTNMDNNINISISTMQCVRHISFILHPQLHVIWSMFFLLLEVTKLFCEALVGQVISKVAKSEVMAHFRIQKSSFSVFSYLVS